MDTDQLSLIWGPEERLKRWTQGMRTVFDENLAGTYILQVNGTDYACNKAVMHAALPSIPEQQWVKRFSAVSADVIPKLLEYLHTCELQISLQNLKPVFKACRVLELSHLADACTEFLVPRLCPQNYIGWLVFSAEQHLPILEQHIKEGILKHLNETRNHREFQELNLSQAIELIREQARLGQSNDNLFRAVLPWIEKHNVDNADDLFSDIDISKCSKNALKLIHEPPYDKLEWPTALRNKLFEACLNAENVDESNNDEASDQQAPSPEEEHCIDWKYPSVMQFAEDMIEAFKDFQTGRHHTDLTLKLSDQDIQVHCAVLSASCPYFETMFRFQQKSEANLSHMDSSVSSIVDYLYLQDIVIPNATLLGFIEVCDYLSLKAELEQCKQHAENGVEILPENCFQWIIGHRLYNLPQTKTRAMKFMCTDFTSVCNLDGLLELNSDELMELLDMENLRSIPEKTLYDVLIAWVSHDHDTRRIHLSKLLKTSAMKESTICADFDVDFLCSEELQLTVGERIQILQTHFDQMIKALQEHSQSVEQNIIKGQIAKLDAEEEVNKALGRKMKDLQAQLKAADKTNNDHVTTEKNLRKEIEKLMARLEAEKTANKKHQTTEANLQKTIDKQRAKLETQEKANNDLGTVKANQEKKINDLETKVKSEKKSKKDYGDAITRLKTQLQAAQTEIKNLKSERTRLSEENNQLKERGLCSMLLSSICCCFDCK